MECHWDICSQLQKEWDMYGSFQKASFDVLGAEEIV